MASLKNNILVSTLREAGKALTAGQRKKAVFFSLLTIVGSALDVLGLAMVIPLIAVAVSPEKIQTNEYLNALYQGMGFTTEDNFLIFMVLVLVAVFIFKNAVGFLIQYLQGRFAYSVATDLSGRLYSVYMKKDLSFVKNHNSAKLITNVLNIPRFFSSGILIPLLTLFSEMLVVIFIVGAIAVYSWQLFALLMPVMGLSFFLIYRSSRKKVSSYGVEKKKIFPKAYGEVSQSFDGIVEIRLHHKFRHFFRRMFRYQERLNDIQFYLFAFNLIPRRANELIAMLGVAIIFMYGLMFAGDRAGIFMILSSFAVAAYRVMPSSNRILASLMSMKSTFYVFDILRDLHDVDAYAGSQTLILPFNHSLEFKDVSFAYPNQDEAALKGLSLSIRKGESVGIIGESGAGKSTFMNMFLRFLIEQEGQFLVDGRQLEMSDTLGWWSLIGYVPQDVFILDGTVRENVAFGIQEDEIDEARLLKALEGANLLGFVQALPKGMDTQIGEKGSRISGGQRQRIGIARALYKNAEIILLDEATASLDAENELLITQTIHNLSRLGKTIVIVAHRVTTLKDCDRIVEFRNGEIVCEYQYESLLKQVVDQNLSAKEKNLK